MRTIQIVPQKQVKIIERLGKYHRTAEAGLNTIVPFLDSVRETIDLREQITKIEPQPVITRDNVTMEVDAVIYSVIVDPVRATYEVQNLRWGLEQLTLSALRNVIGQLDLDHTLVLARHDQLAAARRARHRHAAVGRQGDAHRAEEHHAARRDPADDGEADDRGADAPRRRHHGRGRQVVGHSPRGRSEAVADRDGGGLQAGGDPRGRRAGGGEAARRATPRRRAIQMVAAGDRQCRQSGAVPDRAALPRVARRHRQRREQAGLHALRSDRRRCRRSAGSRNCCSRSDQAPGGDGAWEISAGRASFPARIDRLHRRSHVPGCPQIAAHIQPIAPPRPVARQLAPDDIP